MRKLLITGVIFFFLLILSYFVFLRGKSYYDDSDCKQILSEYYPRVFDMNFSEYKNNKNLLYVGESAENVKVRFATEGNRISKDGPFPGTDIGEYSVSIYITPEGLEGCKFTQFNTQNIIQDYQKMYICNGYTIVTKLSDKEKYYVLEFDSISDELKLKNVFVFNKQIINADKIQLFVKKLTENCGEY